MMSSSERVPAHQSKKNFTANKTLQCYFMDAARETRPAPRGGTTKQVKNWLNGNKQDNNLVQNKAHSILVGSY